MLQNSSSEDIQFPSFDQEYLKEKEVVEPKPAGNKKCLITIIVIVVLLILIAGIILAVYFGSKNKESGGNIKLYFVYNTSDTNFNVINNINLDNDDYLVDYNEGGVSFRLLGESQKSFDAQQCNSGKCNVKITFYKILKSIEGMFSNIKELKYADFSGLNTKKITNMNNLFLNCKNLEYVNFNNFEATKLETMDNAFENCASLTKIDLKSFVTPRLRSMNSAFKGSSNLIQLNMENFLITPQTNIDNIFEGCEHLKDLIPPENNDQLNNQYNNIIKNDTFCEKGNDCEECKKFSNDIKVDICIDCPPGYFLYEKAEYPIKCNKCTPEHCEECEDEFTCKTCEEGFELQITNNNNYTCVENPEYSFDSSIPSDDIPTD